MTSITAPGAEYDSLDPRAGGTYRDKPIWDLDTIEENMNRTGYDWYTNNYGELDDGVLNFGFWNSLEELNNSYYVNETGSIAFNEAYYGGDFSPFNAAQRDVTRKSIDLWADLIEVEFKETKSGDADLTYANTFTGGAQAYAYLPFGDVDDAYYSETYDFSQAGRLSGDVWIDGFVASNFFPLTDSYYATTTMIHETGHALGLSHPGAYNALGPDGEVLEVTYENQAEYAQDSLQYSIMSYFDGYETGAQFIDFQLLNFAYPSTPMIHDIAAIQEIYGANMETRTGDTTYGFNSNLVGTAYDFTANTRPVISIWDAGGTDTLDFSGYKTRSVLDLNAGGFSSAGGADRFYTLEEVNEARVALGFAERTQATYDYYQDLIERLGVTNPNFKDNISIAYGVTIENAVGGAGDDKLIANGVANVLDGGRGADTVSYETATSGVSITLKDGFVAGAGTDANPNGAAGDTLLSIGHAVGSNFDDKIVGNARDNVIRGLQGDDLLIGNGGADTFVFRGDKQGADKVRGFGSDDFLATSERLLEDSNGNVAVIDKTVVLAGQDGSVKLLGANAPTELHLVGTSGGLFYYAATDSDASQATIDALKPSVLTAAETAVQTQAQLDAMRAAAAVENAPVSDVDMAARVEGWNEATATRTGVSSGAFEQRVEFNDHDHGIAPNFAGSLSTVELNLLSIA